MKDVYEKLRSLGVKIEVRGGVWETNSSSVHSTVIMSKADAQRWEDGLYLYYCNWGHPFDYLPEEKRPKNGHVYTEEEVKAFVKSWASNLGYDVDSDEFLEGFDDDRKECDFYLMDEWGRGFEWDYSYHTTESGDEIAIYCYFGYDG